MYGQRDRDRQLLLDNTDPCCVMDLDEPNRMSSSIDAGYESFSSSINSSLDSSSNRSSLGGNDVIMAPPVARTPLKTARFAANLFNTSTTPPPTNKEYAADINSMYLASIRSFNSSTMSDSLSWSSNSSSCSPYRSHNVSHFRNFSTSLSSASSSPIAVAPSQSPGKFLADNYLYERDSFNKKLLRSPAFKVTTSSYIDSSPAKPVISSFTERLKLDSQHIKKPQPAPVRTVTLTEEEFVQRLIQDKLLPSNPRNLIGYNMGIEQLDILSELSERSMPNIVDQILGYMTERELVTIGSVCTSWRGVIKREPKWNQKHSRFVKMKKEEYTVCKENVDISTRQKDAWREKKAVYQSLKGVTNSIDQSLNGTMNESNVSAFGLLDMNCMDNISMVMSNDKSKSVTNSFTVSKDQSRGPLSQVSINRRPVKTLMDCMNVSQQQPVKSILTASPIRGTCSPRKRVPLSPIKPFAGVKKASPSKSDCFGSKKNKKLLKRL